MHACRYRETASFFDALLKERAELRRAEAYAESKQKGFELRDMGVNVDDDEATWWVGAPLEMRPKRRGPRAPLPVFKDGHSIVRKLPKGGRERLSKYRYG